MLLHWFSMDIHTYHQWAWGAYWYVLSLIPQAIVATCKLEALELVKEIPLSSMLLEWDFYVAHTK